MAILLSDLPTIDNRTAQGHFKYGSQKMPEFYSNLDHLGFHLNVPNFNFDVRRSTLSESLEDRDYFSGLFSREKIPKYSIIGNYFGQYSIGYAINPFDQSKRIRHAKQNDYKFAGHRDYIDSAYSGNFLRFVNHQEAANCAVESLFVETSSLSLSGSRDDGDDMMMPKHLEILYFRATADIYPGEELFIDYGESYWSFKESHDVEFSPPRKQDSFLQLSRNYDKLLGKFNLLRQKFLDLSDRLEDMEELFYVWGRLKSCGSDFFSKTFELCAIKVKHYNYCLISYDLLDLAPTRTVLPLKMALWVYYTMDNKKNMEYTDC